ncbi:MAG: hypothetical protein H6992_01230 [Pseudomonadales bacterium]|nr:hypothetical protein [Pseudomonadales bacterium]
MNVLKLKQAEAAFLARYPDGFADAGLAEVRKKHNVDKLSDFARKNLTRTHFNKPQQVCETLERIISRSSMVSMFEKPRFRDFLRSLNKQEKEYLAMAFEKRLHGRARRSGFDEIVAMLAHHKIAKWPVVSAVPYYFAPTREAFVKPTTARGIIAFLEVEGLQYQPLPTWEFYRGYLQLLGQVKKHVRPSLAPTYAALSGFLMSSI